MSPSTESLTAGRLWQVARVVTSASGPLLEMQPVTSCARCAEGRGCGAGVFSGLFGRRTVRLPLPGNLELEAGALVRVGVRGDALMRAALGMYGLPVVAFVVAAAGTGALWSDLLAPWSDLLALGVGLAAGGAVFALPILRPRLEAMDPVFEPLACGRPDAGAGTAATKLESESGRGHFPKGQ